MTLFSRLAELVAFDTQNPSGDERPLVAHLARQLGAVGATLVEETTVGRHAYVYARFGAEPTRVLVNAHVDTVPANTGYTGAPHALVERDGHFVGLGAADTKGAIAALMQALDDRRAAGRPAPRGLAVLFSGDEERGSSCMRHFLGQNPHSAELRAAHTRAIVCEPTGCAVGVRHRGIAAVEVVATSTGGHSSRADEIESPVALLARVAVALDDFGRRKRGEGPPAFRGLCFHVAALDGGIAFNVIATRATLKLSLRPAPGTALEPLLGELERLARAAAAPADIAWNRVAANPPFATRDAASFVPLLGDRARAPVDLAFWTEAALLGEAGIDAVVFGPGRIAQAHAADEYVAPGELDAAHAAFTQMLAGNLPAPPPPPVS